MCKRYSGCDAAVKSGFTVIFFMQISASIANWQKVYFVTNLCRKLPNDEFIVFGQSSLKSGHLRVVLVGFFDGHAL